MAITGEKEGGGGGGGDGGGGEGRGSSEFVENGKFVTKNFFLDNAE